MASSHGSDHDDDAAIEEAVAKDAFGLSSFTSSSKGKAALKDSKASAAKNKTAEGVSSTRMTLVTNPDVLTEDLSKPSTSLITRPTDTLMNINLSYEDMTRPVEGPANVMGQLGGSSGAGLGRSYNTLTGHVEQQAMSNVDFKNQQMTYNVLNYARDPSMLGGSSNGFVGDANAAATMNGQSLQEYRPAKQEIKATKRKRKTKGKLGVFNDDEEEKGDGPSSEEETGREKAYMGPWAGWKDEATKTLVPAEEEYEIVERRRGAVPVDKSKKEVGFGEEKSVFHGKSMHDYQGRTYMHIPRDVDVNLTGESGSQECYIPKTCIHTWSGHTKGVTAVRLFPESGHLLLSSSMDTRVKLWDVYHEGKCLRTFMGHGQAVRDITFNNSGSQFLSASYDRYTKLWDAETGQCVQAFTNGKIPYCVKFNPDPDKQHIFLAGMSDKKIIQYDIRSGEVTQEYDQHLGPVNTINFIDEGRRFVTTSDDKSIRAWDFDIPVVVKYIAEPYMHSLPAVTVHPNKKWLGMQSLDNQILLFSSPDLKQNRKKRFAGHNVAGYACEVGFSPDGKFVSSGDGQGDIVFWDFKTCRLVKRLKAHSKAVISHAWLPHESSKLVTGSWDGLIKLFD